MVNLESMKVSIVYSPAEPHWGENALLSTDSQHIIIHLSGQNDIYQLQVAARKIHSRGIGRVQLVGKEWTLAFCWAFWQGFYQAKKGWQIIWPKLKESESKLLNNRIKTVGWVREVINAPAEELYPETLAQRTIDLLQEIASDNISFTLAKGEKLKELNYQGLYTVGKGSKREPVLLTIDYNPAKKPEAPVFAALVGKGITFDSGGYSLKPSNMMDSMKSDMGGAATLVGALALAILSGLNKRVKLILCCAENLVSGQACKLGDIIYYRNGKTVEIMNTDAEGRLVLADGLLDADMFKPEIIIDCATLTGAAKAAVGNDYHSLFSFDEPLAAQFMQCATNEGEAFWRLPLIESHRRQLASNFADLSNVSSSANSAGASVAAAFLSHFLTNYQTGWLHIDCSATYRKSAVENWSAGATGLGVRSLANFLLKKEKNK